ncbi:MAG: zinc-ribbon domain-containing protein [Asgard group archaeon]
MPASTSPSKCPKCGAHVSSGERRCSYCGMPLR